MYEIPTEYQIENVSGTLTKVREAIDDDPDNYEDHYIVLEVINGGVTRNIVSYDKSLLSRLKTRTRIQAGIFKNRNVSELWQLEVNGDPVVTIDDTDQVRWELIKTQAYIFWIFFILFVGGILFGKGPSWRDADD